MVKSFIIKSENMYIRRIGFYYLLRIESYIKKGIAKLNNEE